MPLTKRLLDIVRTRYPALDAVRTGHELVRRQITIMVEDVIAESQRRIAAANPQSVEDVQAQPRALVGFSDQMRDEEKVLKRFCSRTCIFMTASLFAGTLQTRSFRTCSISASVIHQSCRQNGNQAAKRLMMRARAPRRRLSCGDD